MNIRDRIVDFRRVPAVELRPSPRNWRTHPTHQRDALKGLLAEIGIANAVLARETPEGLELIDGHLRAETLADGTLPVLVLDVDEAEADKLLLTLDPLGAMAGMNYRFFGMQQRKSNHKPFQLNTRIYSCIFLANDVPHRWRGRYNEDTDLSLRFLKDGYCTILFNAFLCNKSETMTVKGGNTESLYKLQDGQDGRLLMAQSLQQQHPDVVKITRKWGRWQHQVDYRPFKHNRLIRKPGVVISDEPNEYGMRLVKRA